MKMNRSSVVVEYRLVSSYEEARRKLLSEEFADRLDKPLAFWALPTDRSSPIALMGKTLRELFSMPFDQLFATPGIGQKKINCLIELFAPCRQPSPSGCSRSDGRGRAGLIRGRHPRRRLACFRGAVGAVAANGARPRVGKQNAGPIGSLVTKAAARDLEYAARRVHVAESVQIRSLKTHGEKRVSAVLEVFGSLHALLASSKTQPHLSLQVLPKFVADVDHWAAAVVRRTVEVDADSIRHSFVDPLMAQVEIDAGEEIAQLAASRLRLDGSGATVRQVCATDGSDPGSGVPAFGRRRGDYECALARCAARDHGSAPGAS